MQHLTGYQIEKLAQKLQLFCQTGAFCTFGEVTFSNNFCFVEIVLRFEQRLDIQELSLDIETGIDTFDS